MNKIISGYILKASPYKENDLIYTVLTKDKLEVFKGRGVLKTSSKFKGYLDIFEYGEFILNPIPNTDKYFVSEINNIKKINNLINDINKYTLISFVGESILKDPYIKNSYLMFEYTFNKLNNQYDLFHICILVLKQHYICNGLSLEGPLSSLDNKTILEELNNLSTEFDKNSFSLDNKRKILTNLFDYLEENAGIRLVSKKMILSIL